jgi:hypothetical protein
MPDNEPDTRQTKKCLSPFVAGDESFGRHGERNGVNSVSLQGGFLRAAGRGEGLAGCATLRQRRAGGRGAEAARTDTDTHRRTRTSTDSGARGTGLQGEKCVGGFFCVNAELGAG